MKRNVTDIYYTVKDNYLCRVYEYEYEGKKHSKDIQRIAYIEDESTLKYIKLHPYTRV